MEEILGQIEKYHRLSIFCFAGMILCGLITGFIYRKRNMKEVFLYYKRKWKQKKIWMVPILCLMCCMPEFMSYATESSGIENNMTEVPEFPEEPADLAPILEKFQIGMGEELLEYSNDYVEIFVSIKDEQNSFNPLKVFLEYRIEGEEEWYLIDLI